MPKSGTWLDGTAIETSGEMDRAGSYDSMSDEGLEHLSEEERACLMFLEETIDALDKDENSGLSNDDCYHMPPPGNVATKAAHLAASMGHRKLDDVSKCHFKESGKTSNEEQIHILNYLVPTPFVLANRTSNIHPNVGLGRSTDKMEPTPKNSKPCSDSPSILSEMNKLRTDSQPKVKSSTEKMKGQKGDEGAESVASRGPLSYDGLVRLRKTASMKKPQASHSLWKSEEHHYIDQTDPTHPNEENGLNCQRSERCFKTGPPAPAPKPKGFIHNPALETQKGAPILNINSTSTYLFNPEKVRMEALYKLGLLTDEVTLKSQHSEHSSALSSSLKDQPYCPHLSSTLQTSESRSKPVQRSHSTHYRFLSDLPTDPSCHGRARPAGGNAASLERSGIGHGNSEPSHNLSDSKKDGSNTGSQQSFISTSENLDYIHGCISLPHKSQGVEKLSTSAPPVTQKASYAPALTVLMVPSVRDEHREALRKLGLLKH